MSKENSNTVQKLVSVFILWCMVAGAFIGLLTTQVGSGAEPVPPTPALVPSIIDGTTFTIENWGTYDADFNITVQNGGTLRIINSTLNFLQDDNTSYFINVNNANLIMENSTITTGATPQAAWDPFFSITLTDATFEMTRNSVLAFPGWLNVTNTNTYINDSWITGLEPAMFYTDWAEDYPTFRDVVSYWWDFTARDLTDAQDDAPIMKFVDCPGVTIADSRIDEQYEDVDMVPSTFIEYFPPSVAATSPPPIGDVNNLINLDLNYMKVSSGLSAQVLDITDFTTNGYNDDMYLVNSVRVEVSYNTSETGVGGYDSSDYIEWCVDGGTFQPILLLQANQSYPPTTTGTSILLSPTPTISELASSNVRFANTDLDAEAAVLFDQILLVVELYPRFNPTSSIVLDNADMSIINSYVGIDWTSAIDNYHAKNAFDLINGANLHLYNMSISEDEGGITGIRDFLEIPVGADPLLDYMPIRVGSDCEAYYYKWLDIEVVDKYGLAVPDAIINSTFYFTNQTVVDMVFEINDLTNTTDSAKVRMTDYLNRVYGVIPAEFNMTGSNGHAMIPLLTTFLNSTNYPNGDHVGEYEVDVNYGTNYSYTPCDFRPFPNIMPADNTVSYQVSLDGLALPRPIGSPGLVVNFNTGDVSIGGSAVEPMTINDFIVVEDSATLTITNANLKLAYSDTAPFEIIVRGQGTLILNNVAMSTQGSTPITITLMDGANLTMTGSRTTSAMNIMAYDDAEIVLDTTVLGGGFGTGPDANVRLWARSTSFAQSITKFTGTSEARLIGCYSPSAAFTIQPTGNAFVWIYRWVAITVNNGLTPPNGLTNAYVWINTTTHPQFAATLNNNGLTNITGVYRVPVISDLINATGSTPYNNYKVDTQYVGYAKTHSKSISLGLPTYSLNEMLQANALAARTVVLENVLPDLAPILTVFPLMANSSIGRGNEILVNATISNIGDATATGIVVWFQDYYDGAPTTMHQEVIQTLASTQFINISFPYTWYLASDVGQHNITVSITPLKEQDTANNKDYVNLNVTSQADLAIRQYSDVWFSDNNPLVDRQFTIYSNVWNLGDANATDVLVSFYELNSGALLGNATVANIPVDSVAVASIPVTFTMNSTYYILVYVDRADAITEVDETNNNNSAWPRQLIVREYPGLAITDFSVVEGTNMANIGLGFGTVIIETSNRTMVTLRARVQNDGEMFASGVYVNFYNGPTLIGRSNTLSTISSGSAAYAMLAMEALTPGLQQIYNLRAIAYESSGLGLTSNEALQTFTVYDNRPDMSIDEIILANNMTQATDGNAFLLNVTISNNGISDAAEFAVEVYASQEDYNATKLMHANGNEQFQGRLNHTLVELLETGDNITLTMRCTSITVGNQTLFIFVDPELNNSDAIDYDGITSLYGDIEEYNELNNNDTYEVPVVMPELRIILQIPAIGNNVFVEGEVESVLITGLVVRADSANIGVEGILVTIIVGDNAPVIVNSSAGGFFSTSVAVTAAGNYTIRAYGDDINEVQSWFRIDTAPSIPWWILIVIALAVVAVIVGIGLYLYFVGLGKTVQCGECSAFIPEGAAKCPKCGVEFETEVAKCSVCGAWVPMDVKNCPDCGTEFTVGTENLDDYEAKMKRQFEDVVRKFRDEAKNDLGQEFTETEFQAWWAKQPTFITFDLWLKEDEEMKRMGSRPCPVCQMENSVTAKICHKCGSVMGEPDTPPKKPEGKLPPAKPEGKMPPVGAKPGEQPKQVPPQQAAAPKPAQQQPQATPQQVPAQQVAPQSAQPSPASQPSSAQPGKKACPSCGMEVNIAEKNCPICNHEFQDKPPEGGDHTRRIIRKPIKKVVRRPMEGGGDQQGGQ